MKFSSYQSYYQSSQSLDRDQIFLPPAEYAMVMGELNSHLSDEDRRHKIISKPIGNYVYVFINRGYDDYVIIGKYLIDAEDESAWEE